MKLEQVQNKILVQAIIGKQITYTILLEIVGNGVKRRTSPATELAGEAAATTILALAIQPLAATATIQTAASATDGSRPTLIVQP